MGALERVEPDHAAVGLLELYRLLAMGDTSRAADLLDNASRGALTAVRFL